MFQLLPLRSKGLKKQEPTTPSPKRKLGEEELADSRSSTGATPSRGRNSRAKVALSERFQSEADQRVAMASSMGKLGFELDEHTAPGGRVALNAEPLRLSNACQYTP